MFLCVCAYFCFFVFLFFCFFVFLFFCFFVFLFFLGREDQFFECFLELGNLSKRRSPTSDICFKAKSRSSLVCAADKQNLTRPVAIEVAGYPTTTTAIPLANISRLKALRIIFLCLGVLGFFLCFIYHFE